MKAIIYPRTLLSFVHLQQRVTSDSGFPGGSFWRDPVLQERIQGLNDYQYYFGVSYVAIVYYAPKPYYNHQSPPYYVGISSCDGRAPSHIVAGIHDRVQGFRLRV